MFHWELFTNTHLLFNVSQIQQFRIFNDLLQLVPGLKNRILDGVPEDVTEIAELVRYWFIFSIWFTMEVRFQEGHQVPDLMIRKASKAQ